MYVHDAYNNEIILFKLPTAIDVAIHKYGNDAVGKLLDRNKLDHLGHLNDLMRKNLEDSAKNPSSSVESTST